MSPDPRQLSWTRTDLGLILAALALSLLGSLLIWSATRHTFGASLAIRHVLNLVVGLALAIVIMRTDFRTIRSAAPLVYAGAVLALLAVLSPLGSTINGSRSWIEIPGFSLQPAEFVKVALCIALAMILAERGERGAPPPQRDVLIAVAVFAVPALLVLAQPDLGSVAVLVALAVGVIAVCGARRCWDRQTR